MIIKVKVKIESTIENLDEFGLIAGEAEKSVTEVNGIYRYADDVTFLAFAEDSEGGKINTNVFCFGDSVTVKREGAVESNMQFAVGEIHSSIYSIPPYQFDVTVNAKRVKTELFAVGGSIDLLYNMKIGGADKNARMKIWISQASKQA